MEDRVDRAVDLERLRHIGFDEGEPRTALQISDVGAPAGAEVVDGHDLFASGQQGTGQHSSRGSPLRR